MKLPEPEEYNVLHIGPECKSALERSIVHQSRKSKIFSFLMFLFMGAMFFGLVMVNSSLEDSVAISESQIASLIDEVGSLSQENFVLSEQVNSQEAVLQSLEDDLTELLANFQSGNPDSKVLGSLFSNIFAELSKTTKLNLSEDVILSSTEDSTFDVLILGTNGAHTDTILVASVNAAKQKITLFSIPRDLYINGRRINEYFTYYGVEQLNRMVESVTGLKMDKYVQVDLEGFVQVVDILGGLDIYVDTAIYDSTYPNGQGGVSTYSIDVGHYHMDGSEALKYARSRHNSSDFDRAARQQKVLYSLRNKIVQLDSVMDMKELTQLFQTGLLYTETNVELLDLVSYYYDFQEFNLETGFVLSTSNYLYSIINESGAYILLPNTGNFEQIHGVISQLVN